MEQVNENWIAKIEYARKTRYLGTFSTQEECSRYLEAVRDILESFGKTRDEVDAMTDAQGKSAVQKARYEAEAMLGIPPKIDHGAAGGKRKQENEGGGSERKKQNLQWGKSAYAAMSMEAGTGDIHDALEKIINQSLKSLDEDRQSLIKMQAGKTVKPRSQGIDTQRNAMECNATRSIAMQRVA